jgi:hypothetical protein
MRMPGRTQFVAIRVGKGDAFFLEREGAKILVDGGFATREFPRQFRRVTKCSSLDVLVCSHNDTDHANGVLGYLEAGLHAEEVWLPGSWANRLQDLVFSPDGFLKELAVDIRDSEPTERTTMLEDLGNELFDSTQREAVEAHKGGPIAAVWDRVEEEWNDADFHFPGLWRLPCVSKDAARGLTIVPRHLLPGNTRSRILLEALDAGDKIRRIFLAACRLGSTIRWFEFRSSGSPSRGLPGVLVPVNAVEILRVPKPRLSALDYLALTTVNRESLVFQAPISNDHPPVLFTADSDLKFGQPIPNAPGMLVTAPHHGSEDNAYAYRRLSNPTGPRPSLTWVRSDEETKKRPGKSYVSASGTKYCTACRPYNLSKQNVRLSLVSGQWVPASARTCCCR